MSIFATCFAYHYRHLVGEAWEETIARELASLGDSRVPGLRTLGRMFASPEDPVTVSIHASTLIARARSQAAGEFLHRHPDADVWVSVDEDVFSTPGVVARLVALARTTKGFVSAPCWLRRDARVNFHVGEEPRIDRAGEEILVTDDEFRSGFGLVAIHRSAVIQMARTAEWVTQDGAYPALFKEYIADGRWIGEDFAFSNRARAAGVPMHALCNVWTDHADRMCSIELRDGKLEAIFDRPTAPPPQ